MEERAWDACLAFSLIADFAAPLVAATDPITGLEATSLCFQ